MYFLPQWTLPGSSWLPFSMARKAGMEAPRQASRCRGTGCLQVTESTNIFCEYLINWEGQVFLELEIFPFLWAFSCRLPITVGFWEAGKCPFMYKDVFFSWVCLGRETPPCRPDSATVARGKGG